MQEKDIERLATKQSKEKFPHWDKLNWEGKKELAKQVLKEVMSGYR